MNTEKTYPKFRFILNSALLLSISGVLSARAHKWLAHRSVKFVPSMTFYLANRYHYSCFVSGIRWILPRKFLTKGASIYYIRKIFGILDPLPPCSQSGLIYSTKFTQPPLLHSHSGQIFRPPLPLSSNIINGSPLTLIINKFGEFGEFCQSSRQA